MKNDLPQNPPSRLRKVISAITVASYMVMSIGQSYAMDNPTVAPEGYSKGRKLSQIGVDPVVNLSDALEEGKGGEVELTSTGDSKLPVGANTSVVIRDATLENDEGNAGDNLSVIPKISDKEKEGLDKLNAYFKDRFSATKTEHQKRLDKMTIALILISLPEIYGEYLLQANDSLYSMELTDPGYRYEDMEPKNEFNIELIKYLGILGNAIISLTPYIISRSSLFMETFYPSPEKRNIKEKEGFGSIFASSLLIGSASIVAAGTPALSVYSAYVGFRNTEVEAKVFPAFLAEFYGFDAILRYCIFKNHDVKKTADSLYAHALSYYHKNPKFIEEFKKTSEERHHLKGSIHAVESKLPTLTDEQFFEFKDSFMALGKEAGQSGVEQYKSLLAFGAYEETVEPEMFITTSYKSIKSSLSSNSFKESVKVDEIKQWCSKNWLKLIFLALGTALAVGGWSYLSQGYKSTLETPSIILSDNTKYLGTPALQAVAKEGLKIFKDDTENLEIFNNNGTDWCTSCFAHPHFSSGSKENGGTFKLRNCPGVPYKSIELVSDPGNFDYIDYNCYGLYGAVYYTFALQMGNTFDVNGTEISTGGFKIPVPKVGRETAEVFGDVAATVVSLYGAVAAKNGLKVIAESYVTNPVSLSISLFESFVRASTVGFKYFTDKNIKGEKIVSWDYLTIAAITTLAALNYFGDFNEVYRRVPNSMNKMLIKAKEKYSKLRGLNFEQKRYRSIEQNDFLDILSGHRNDLHTMDPSLIDVLGNVRKSLVSISEA